MALRPWRPHSILRPHGPVICWQEAAKATHIHKPHIAAQTEAQNHQTGQTFPVCSYTVLIKSLKKGFWSILSPNDVVCWCSQRAPVVPLMHLVSWFTAGEFGWEAQGEVEPPWRRNWLGEQRSKMCDTHESNNPNKATRLWTDSQMPKMCCSFHSVFFPVIHIYAQMLKINNKWDSQIRLTIILPRFCRSSAT